MPIIKLIMVLATLLLLPLAARAQTTVECSSTHHQYNECQAPLRAPQLIHQISSSSCINTRDLPTTLGFYGLPR